MNFHDKALAANVLVLLGPQLLEELDKIFPFQTSRILPVPPEEALTSFPISSRQKSRAIESLSRREAFWDRVGEQIIIPIAPSGRYLGVVVLHGPDRDASPDEAESWLPLLRDWLEKGLRRNKMAAQTTSQGTLPMMLKNIMDQPAFWKQGPFNLLYLRFNTKKDLFNQEKVSVRPLVEKAFENVLFLGGNFRELWYLVTLPDDVEQGASRLHRLIANAKIKRLGLEKIFAMDFDEQLPWTDQKKACAEFAKTASLLDTDVFTSAAQAHLETMFKLDSLPHFLQKAFKLKKGLENHIICYASPLTKPMIKRLSNNKDIKFVMGSQSSALVAMPLTKASLDDKIRDLRKSIVGHSKKKVTFGICLDSVPKPQMGALWAYRHAALLGEGKTAIFDDVTLNVAGDEMFGWGDLSGSLRQYRKGVKLGPGNSNLWNSLGVCLVHMGRKKEAIQAFRKAAKLDPSSFMAVYNLGCAYLTANDPHNALKNLKRALEINPENLAAATRLSSILLDRARYKEVTDLLAPWLSKNNATPLESLQIAAKAYWKLGNWTQAKRLWHKIVAAYPNNSEALAYLALGYAQKAKDIETARRLVGQLNDFDFGTVFNKKERALLSKALGLPL